MSSWFGRSSKAKKGSAQDLLQNSHSRDGGTFAFLQNNQNVPETPDDDYKAKFDQYKRTAGALETLIGKCQEHVRILDDFAANAAQMSAAFTDTYLCPQGSAYQSGRVDFQQFMCKVAGAHARHMPPPCPRTTFTPRSNQVFMVLAEQKSQVQQDVLVSVTDKACARSSLLRRRCLAAPTFLPLPRQKTPH